MSVKRWSLLVLLALCSWGGWWFLSRAFELARETADESHARAYIRRIDEAQKGFLKDNPGQGFACKLDDLRRAGLASPSENKYSFELCCDRGERPPEMEYLVVERLDLLVALCTSMLCSKFAENKKKFFEVCIRHDFKLG